MAVIADVDADAGKPGLENWITQITRLEIELLPESGMGMRYMILTVLSQVATISVDYGGSVVIDPGNFFFINGDDQDHLMLASKLLHKPDCRAVGDLLNRFVPF